MYCPICLRKRRVGEKRKTIKGRRYWLIYCVICKTDLALEDFQDYEKKDD